MFNLTKKTISDECCRCEIDDEITDENIAQAAATLSSIRHLDQKECYDIIAAWMVLFAGLGQRSQQRVF